VADASLRKDRKIKPALYASAGIAEYWLVDLRGRTVEVHRGPGPAGYADVTRVAPGGSLTLLAFPDVTVQVDAILP
jgi:Uma2 family endonuclease